MFGFGQKKAEPSENQVENKLLQAEIVLLKARLDTIEQKHNQLKGWCYKQKQIFENPDEKEKNINDEHGIVGFGTK